MKLHVFNIYSRLKASCHFCESRSCVLKNIQYYLIKAGSVDKLPVQVAFPTALKVDKTCIFLFHTLWYCVWCAF